MLVSFERRKFISFFFRFELYTQKNITVGFSTIQWDSLTLTLRIDHDFWKNICQVKYSSVRNLPLYILADFQNVNCFVFEQSTRTVYHKATVQNIYNVYYYKTSLMCIFNVVKMLSSIGFIVDALFGNFAYLHNLYTAVELHTNFVLIHFGSQPFSIFSTTYTYIRVLLGYTSKYY